MPNKHIDTERDIQDIHSRYTPTTRSSEQDPFYSFLKDSRGIDIPSLDNVHPIGELSSPRYIRLHDKVPGLSIVDPNKLESIGKELQTKGEAWSNASSQFYANFIAGIVGQIDGVAKIKDQFSDDPNKWTTALSRYAKRLRDDAEKESPIYDDTHEFEWSSKYLAKQYGSLGTSVGIILPSVIEGALTAYLTKGISLPLTAIKLGRTLSKVRSIGLALTRYMAASGVQGLANVNMNATETYEDTYGTLVDKYGFSPDKAKKVAHRAAMQDMYQEVVPSVLIGGGLLQRGIVSTIKSFGKKKLASKTSEGIFEMAAPKLYDKVVNSKLGRAYNSKLGGYITNIAYEGIQEGVENISSQKARVDQMAMEGIYEDINMNENIDEVFGGAAFASVLGLFGLFKKTRKNQKQYIKDYEDNQITQLAQEITKNNSDDSNNPPSPVPPAPPSPSDPISPLPKRKLPLPKGPIRIDWGDVFDDDDNGKEYPSNNKPKASMPEVSKKVISTSKKPGIATIGGGLADDFDGGEIMAHINYNNTGNGSKLSPKEDKPINSNVKNFIKSYNNGGAVYNIAGDKVSHLKVVKGGKPAIDESKNNKNNGVPTSCD